MRVLVIGASGGTGREAVRELLGRGHEVTAFARGADRLEPAARLTRVRGDALSTVDVAAAVAGHDAVIVTLGITESPLLVRLGIRRTPIDVRSRGTANVVAAMTHHGVSRLVVQTTYGVGPTRARLSLGWKLIFSLLLAPQIADTELQEQRVRASGLDWTLVRPVGLGDGPPTGPVHVTRDDTVRGMAVTRAQVASVLVDAALDAREVHQSLAVSS